jgi:hypothetical protein
MAANEGAAAKKRHRLSPKAPTFGAAVATTEAGQPVRKNAQGQRLPEKRGQKRGAATAQKGQPCGHQTAYGRLRAWMMQGLDMRP